MDDIDRDVVNDDENVMTIIMTTITTTMAMTAMTKMMKMMKMIKTMGYPPVVSVVCSSERYEDASGAECGGNGRCRRGVVEGRVGGGTLGGR